jgi:aminoglycoside phosphotransferase (APT) family kinase protein
VEVAEVVAGHLGAAGVREVVENPFRYGLGELLITCLPEVSEPAHRLLRSKFKPGRKLTAYYELSVAGSPRHCALVWTTERSAAVPGPAVGRDDAVDAGPFVRLSAVSDDGHVSLLVSPADPAMPQLRRLAEPDHLAAVMSRLIGRTVPAPRADDVRTIRYRPGERHVLMVRSGPGRPAVVVKTDRDDSGRRAVPVATALAPLLAARLSGAELAEPLGYVEGDQAALWSQASGAPLSQQLTQTASRAIQLVRLMGQSVRAWHESGQHVPPAVRQQVEDAGVRDVASELAITRRAGELIAALLPDVWSTYEAVLAEVAEALHAPDSPEDTTLIHGDLKSDNVLVAGGRLRLLDLDRVAVADRALDLGKFLADLSWWCRDEARASALGAAFRSGYGAFQPRLWSRTDLIAQVYQLRFAARRCAVHDPSWEAEVTRQVDDAAEAVGRRWRP